MEKIKMPEYLKSLNKVFTHDEIFGNMEHLMDTELRRKDHEQSQIKYGKCFFCGRTHNICGALIIHFSPIFLSMTDVKGVTVWSEWVTQCQYDAV